MKVFKKSALPLTQEQIADWLRELRGSPYVAASGFDVTSVFRAKIGDDDTYYFAGVNVENPDHRLSTHGEEGSISAMATALGKKAEIVEGWVMGAPKALNKGDTHPLADNCVSCCGKCRQQIASLADPAVKIHSISLNGTHKETTVGEFLPDAFTFRQFAPELASRGDAAKFSMPSVQEVESRLIRTGTLSEDEIKAWLRELESVDFASKTSQTVIVKLANGAYVAGVKVEEAAFVSIDPMQAVMAIANAEFGEQKVLEVYTFGKGCDEAKVQPEAYTPLSGSAVQVLTQFAAHSDIPIHMVNGKNESKTIKLSDTARYIPTFDQPVCSVGPERFVK